MAKKITRLPPWNLVQAYSLRWSAAKNRGSVQLYLADKRRNASIEVDSPQELSALGDMLRNESPIFFNPKFNELYTGAEPPGDLEPIRQS